MGAAAATTPFPPRRQQVTTGALANPPSAATARPALQSAAFWPFSLNRAAQNASIFHDLETAPIPPIPPAAAAAPSTLARYLCKHPKCAYANGHRLDRLGASRLCSADLLRGKIEARTCHDEVCTGID